MTAIFIGRFQPFHKGHLEAIKWILKRKKKVFIVIGSSQKFSTKENPFSFLERKKMIKKSLLTEKIKNFKIFGAPDFIEDDILWAKKVLKITRLNPKKALIFTKNLWTKKCFKKIGIKVLPHPMFFNKLSATKIRGKIAKSKNWENLVPEIVSNFLKKIKGEKRIKSIFKRKNRLVLDKLFRMFIINN